MANKVQIIQLNEGDKADVVRMRNQGSTLREIAEYIGCSVNAVVYHLRSAGITNSFRWTTELDGQLVEMYNSGSTISSIALFFGRTKGNVWHRISYLRKLNKSIKYRRKL